jgi:hypothetical protein
MAYYRAACHFFAWVVVRRHVWRLPPFSCRRTHQRLPAGVVILDLYADDGADARKGVGHHADQGAIALPDQGRRVDAVEQPARFLLGQHRRLAAPHDMASVPQIRASEGRILRPPK